jgi:hypothetical protein
MPIIVNKKSLRGMSVVVLALGMVLLGCPTDGGGGNGGGNSSIAYTNSNGYVLTLTPIAAAKSALSLESGTTYNYTLTYHREVISHGIMTMEEGTDNNAIFEPSSSGSSFTGTIGEGFVSIPIATLDDGGTIVLGTMEEATAAEAAFTEYWGTWQGIISGASVRLVIGDGTWVLYINGSRDSDGTWTQTSATTADIFDPSNDPAYRKVGRVTTKSDGGLTIVLTVGYPGTYALTRADHM